MGESHDDEVLKALVSALGGTLGEADSKYDLPSDLLRTDDYMQHPVFHKYRLRPR